MAGCYRICSSWAKLWPQMELTGNREKWSLITCSTLSSVVPTFEMEQYNKFIRINLKLVHQPTPHNCHKLYVSHQWPDMLCDAQRLFLNSQQALESVISSFGGPWIQEMLNFALVAFQRKRSLILVGSWVVM